LVALAECFNLGDDGHQRVGHPSPTSAVPR
jgi:hypothetical protein